MAPNDDATSRGLPMTLADDEMPAASVMVAQTFTSDRLPLGLEVALPLRGGHCPRHARMNDLGLGWQRELRVVMETAAAGVRSDAGWFELPPLLLWGPTGAGRTHIARSIARAAGLPHVAVMVGGTMGLEQLRPSACGPDLLLPSAPVLAMAVSRCANPVVCIHGAETLDAAGQVELARMIDPASAGRWIDYACGATIDLRHVNWIVQGGEPGSLVPALQALLRPVRLRVPEGDEVPLLLVEVLAEAAIDLGLIERVGCHARDGLDHLSRLPGPHSTARIYEAARHWLETHIR